MKISSLSSGRAADIGISLFVQYLPLYWALDQLTEALVFCNFPFNTHGEITRFLLHYLDEFISDKLQNHANIVLQYSLVVALSHPTNALRGRRGSSSTTILSRG